LQKTLKNNRKSHSKLNYENIMTETFIFIDKTIQHMIKYKSWPCYLWVKENTMVDLEKRARTYIDEHSDERYSLLSDLLPFDSRNFISYGREKECQIFVADFYRKLDLQTDVYSPDSVPGIKDCPGYLSGRGMEVRPNVTGICYGTTPDGRTAHESALHRIGYGTFRIPSCRVHSRQLRLEP
jgi:hypothetical protein